MQHVIQRQTIAINTADMESAKIVQQYMDILLKPQLITMMDEVFSSFSADRTTIRLEKLELDLGSFSMDNLDTQFTEKLKKQLIKELKKELLHSPDAALQKNRKSTIQSQEESDIELVLYYLQQGVLPWWLADAEAFQLQTLLDKLFNYSADEFIHELERLNCIQAIERLVKQLTGDHYELLLNRISLTADGNTAGSIVQAIQDWNRLIDAADLELRQVIQIKARLIYFLLQSFPVEQSANILSEYIGRTALISSGSDTERNIVTSLALNAQTLLSDNSEVYLWIDQKMLQLFPSTEMRFSTVSSSAILGSAISSSAVSSSAISGSAVSDNNAINSAADKRTAVAADKKQLPFAKGVPGQLLQTDAAADNWPDTGDHYYINNAGVILLWPFLSPYFSTLNLLKDKKFVSEQSQEKAVLLLQYLVSGNVEPQEHVLLLSKLLCGWPLQQPLLRAIELTQQDKQESEELVLSVIEHWKALKNTSMDGLRQSFLQREGRLTEKDYGWDLLIKRTGFDVLLDQLPWGISTIHLSWMQKTVFVEW